MNLVNLRLPTKPKSVNSASPEIVDPLRRYELTLSAPCNLMRKSLSNAHEETNKQYGHLQSSIHKSFGGLIQRMGRCRQHSRSRDCVSHKPCLWRDQYRPSNQTRDVPLQILTSQPNFDVDLHDNDRKYMNNSANRDLVPLVMSPQIAHNSPHNTFHNKMSSPTTLNSQSKVSIKFFNNLQICMSPDNNPKGYIELRLPKIRVSSNNPYGPKKISTGYSMIKRDNPHYDTIFLECVKSKSTVYDMRRSI